MISPSERVAIFAVDHVHADWILVGPKLGCFEANTALAAAPLYITDLTDLDLR